MENTKKNPENQSNSLQFTETSYLEAELRLTLEEIAHLHNALAEANMRLAALQNQEKKEVASNAWEGSNFSQLYAELNPLLVTISNYIDLLASQSVGTLGPLQTRFIERITHSVEQVQQILSEYKDAKKPSQVKSSEENQCSLSDIIQEVISENNFSLQSKQIALQLCLPKTAPTVMGSSEDIHTIISTFFNNALKTTPSQEFIRLSLTVENINHSFLVQFLIIDGGPGIATKSIPNLLSIHGEQIIPGFALTRSQLITANQLILDQGGYLVIENADDVGCQVKIQFLPVKS